MRQDMGQAQGLGGEIVAKTVSERAGKVSPVPAGQRQAISMATPSAGPRKGNGNGAAAGSVDRSKSRQEAAGDETASRSRPLDEFPELADVLPELCERYRAIADQQKKLEAERKELSAQIMPLMEAVGWDSIAGDGWLALRVHGRNERLSPEKLLESGVSMAVIKKCTTVAEYDYVQVRERK